MLKKIFYSVVFYMIFLENIYAEPPIWCAWLPFCEEENNLIGDSAGYIFIDEVWWKLVSELIQYVAVIAVISLMISWIMYLLSWWEEEKVKRAKSWIIWSLVWVVLSIWAWGIVNIINEISI